MLQQILVLLFFLSALGYLGWRTWQSVSRRKAGGCGKGCGCETDKVHSSASAASDR
jgi:hypothetical protein